MTARLLLPILCCCALSSTSSFAEETVFEPLKQLKIQKSFSYPATVVNTQQVKISSQISGSIVLIPFKVGDQVKRNQTLVSLDCTDHELLKQQSQAALNRLNTQKDLAQQQLKRAKRLVAIKSISSQELEQKQTALDANIASIAEQKAGLSIIENTISKCQIKAPFSGVITQKMIEKGSFVSPANPLAELINPEAVEIESDLPTSLINDLQNSQQLMFKQNGQSFSLSIRAVLPVTNPDTQMQTVRLNISKAPYPLSNSLGNLQWVSAKSYIPSRYLAQRNGKLGVFIKTDKNVRFKPLITAIEGQDSLINMKENTLIATNNLLTLKDQSSEQ